MTIFGELVCRISKLFKSDFFQNTLCSETIRNNSYWKASVRPSVPRFPKIFGIKQVCYGLPIDHHGVQKIQNVILIVFLLSINVVCYKFYPNIKLVLWGIIADFKFLKQHRPLFRKFLGSQRYSFGNKLIPNI